MAADVDHGRSLRTGPVGHEPRPVASVTCSCPKVARKRRTTSRPARCRAVVRAGGLAHRQAWPATLEAGRGDRRQSLFRRLAARRAALQADRPDHPEPGDQPTTPTSTARPTGSATWSNGWSASSSSSAHHDALKQERPARGRRRAPLSRRGLGKALIKAALGSSGLGHFAPLSHAISSGSSSSSRICMPRARA